MALSTFYIMEVDDDRERLNGDIKFDWDLYEKFVDACHKLGILKFPTDKYAIENRVQRVNVSDISPGDIILVDRTYCPVYINRFGNLFFLRYTKEYRLDHYKKKRGFMSPFLIEDPPAIKRIVSKKSDREKLGRRCLET